MRNLGDALSEWGDVWVKGNLKDNVKGNCKGNVKGTRAGRPRHTRQALAKERARVRRVGLLRRQFIELS